jgi:hypothetical protein
VSVIGRLGTTQEALWRDHHSRTLLVSDGTTANVNVSSQTSSNPEHNRLVKGYANNIIDSSRRDFSITTYKVELPITDRVKRPKADKPSTIAAFFDPNSYHLNRVLNLEATAGILSDTWAADSEAQYKQQTRRLVATESSTRLLVSPLGAVATLGGVLFPEAAHGRVVDFVAPTHVVLDKYKE